MPAFFRRVRRPGGSIDPAPVSIPRCRGASSDKTCIFARYLRHVSILDAGASSDNLHHQRRVEGASFNPLDAGALLQTATELIEKFVESRFNLRCQRFFRHEAGGTADCRTVSIPDAGVFRPHGGRERVLFLPVSILDAGASSDPPHRHYRWRTSSVQVSTSMPGRFFRQQGRVEPH